MVKRKKTPTKLLVGGFNPFETYARQNGFIFPNFRGENKTYLKPPTSKQIQVFSVMTSDFGAPKSGVSYPVRGPSLKTTFAQLCPTNRPFDPK